MAAQLGRKDSASADGVAGFQAGNQASSKTFGSLTHHAIFLSVILSALQ